jgi:hypothetical protein
MAQGYVPNRFTVSPPKEVTEALGEMAQDRNQNPRDLAALLIERGLEQEGYLDGDQARLTLVLSRRQAARLVATLQENGHIEQEGLVLLPPVLYPLPGEGRPYIITWDPGEDEITLTTKAREALRKGAPIDIPAPPEED